VCPHGAHGDTDVPAVGVDPADQPIVDRQERDWRVDKRRELQRLRLMV
jgi:hypothetical protein